MMSPDADNLRALSIRELSLGVAFFLLPFLGFIALTGKGDGSVVMTVWPAFLVAVVLSPIGVIWGENVSPNHSNFTRAVIFFISGFVFLLGWRVILAGNSILILITYAILGPIVTPAVVSMPKKLL